MVVSSLIETGVDKLMNLIRREKRISVSQASKELGVSPVVIEEWADFLEEEGIIHVDYKLATQYLVMHELTPEEEQKRAVEFKGRQEGFARKAEVTLAMLDRDSEGFKKIKQEFEGLKKYLAEELGNVRGELGELERYEKLKDNVDKDIREEQKKFKERIEEIENQISRENKRYKEVIGEIEEEQQVLDKEKEDALSLREQEHMLRKQLEDFEGKVHQIEKGLADEGKQITNSVEHIDRLKKIASSIRQDVEEKMAGLKDLLKESEATKQKILDIQESILAKAQKKKEAIASRYQEGKEASDKFLLFFRKKSRIEDLLNSLEKDMEELEAELIQLVKKARAFELASKGGKPVTHYLKEIDAMFKKVEAKKEKYEGEVRRLSSLLSTSSKESGGGILKIIGKALKKEEARG